MLKRWGRLIPACAGNAPTVPKEAREVRLIPACAGNAYFQWIVHLTLTAHPRVRGERRVGATSFLPNLGSSPRARGTRALTTAQTLSSPAHPRVRGERPVP